MATHPEDRTLPRAEPATPPIAARWSGAGRAFAIVGGVVLTVAALKLARPVLVPLVAGLFLAVLARPVHRRLGALLPRRLRWLALVAAMLVIVAGVLAFGAAVGWSLRAVGDEFRSRRPEIEARMAPVRERASRMGITIPQMPGGAQGASGAQAPAGGVNGGRPEGQQGSQQSGQQGSQQGGGEAKRALINLVTSVGELLLALAFAALALAETSTVRRRIAHLGRAGGGRDAIAAIDEMAEAFRRYAWVKTLTSALTGLVTWLIALAFGLPLAWVWGFIAFLFEYVPTVGSLLAVAPPVLMALAEGGPAKAGMVLLGVGAAQVILGNVVDPKLEGRLMAVSPFGVLFSIVFWGWLWGAVGALLAVPLTVALVIASRHIPGMRGVATVVAGDGVPDEEKE